MDLHRRQAILDRIRLDRAGVLELLRAVRQPDKDYAEIANRLVPGAGDYLHAHQLELLVRDDIAIEVARTEVQRQKRYVQRLVDLLPTLLRYFEFEAEADVVRALHLIDDCFHDFPIIKSGPRRDRALRDAISTIERAEKAVGQAVTALAALDRLGIGVEIDMDHFLNAYLERVDDQSSRQDFRIFLEHLRLRQDILKICLLRAKSQDGYLFLLDNQAKTHVVEHAYMLSLWHNGPPLVTTPGSDFSIVCGLLYEIVGGKTNESLAGAINRFARSAQRREIDECEREIERDNAVGDSDNFFGVKEEARRAAKAADTYIALFEKAKGLGDRPRYMIKILLENAIERGTSAIEKYGPHIVWAHQAPSLAKELKVTNDKMHTAQERYKRAVIALGESRRRKRQRG
jgi:hypothetical protein